MTRSVGTAAVFITGREEDKTLNQRAFGRLMRSHVILSAAMFLIILIAPVNVTAGGVIDLQGAGTLVDSLTKAVLAIPDLVEESFSTGDAITRKQAAMSARNKLTQLSRELSGLTSGQHTLLEGSLQNYIDHPTPDNWSKFEAGLDKVLIVVGGLEADLKRNDTDFVLRRPYRDMLETLGEREALAGRYVHIPPPTTPSELIALKEFELRYKVLVTKLNVAIDKLNSYVLTLP